jgi:hypothetical protein
LPLEVETVQEMLRLLRWRAHGGGGGGRGVEEGAALRGLGSSLRHEALLVRRLTLVSHRVCRTCGSPMPNVSGFVGLGLGGLGLRVAATPPPPPSPLSLSLSRRAQRG